MGIDVQRQRPELNHSSYSLKESCSLPFTSVNTYDKKHISASNDV